VTLTTARLGVQSMADANDTGAGAPINGRKRLRRLIHNAIAVPIQVVVLFGFAAVCGSGPELISMVLSAPQ